jgi:hypothetical protein
LGKSIAKGEWFLTEENIIALFDITEKQMDSGKISISRDTAPKSLNLDHTDEGEVMLDREIMTLGYGGRIVRPIFTRHGLEFIDTDYLTPLADVADALELFERRTEDGEPYFAAKMGLMIVGVIMPLNIVSEKLVDHIDTLAIKCRDALKIKNERAAARAADGRGDQTELTDDCA